MESRARHERSLSRTRQICSELLSIRFAHMAASGCACAIVNGRRKIFGCDWEFVSLACGKCDDGAHFAGRGREDADAAGRFAATAG
jgi:hypothetical protein